MSIETNSNYSSDSMNYMILKTQQNKITNKFNIKYTKSSNKNFYNKTRLTWGKQYHKPGDSNLQRNKKLNKDFDGIQKSAATSKLDCAISAQ